MKLMECENLGPLKRATTSISDISAFVGARGTGKSLLLEVLPFMSRFSTSGIHAALASVPAWFRPGDVGPAKLAAEFELPWGVGGRAKNGDRIRYELCLSRDGVVEQERMFIVHRCSTRVRAFIKVMDRRGDVVTCVHERSGSEKFETSVVESRSMLTLFDQEPSFVAEAFPAAAWLASLYDDRRRPSAPVSGIVTWPPRGDAGFWRRSRRGGLSGFGSSRRRLLDLLALPHFARSWHGTVVCVDDCDEGLAEEDLRCVALAIREFAGLGHQMLFSTSSTRIVEAMNLSPLKTFLLHQDGAVVVVRDFHELSKAGIL